MLWKAAISSWPLFFGMLLLMLANGLMLTLVTVRGTELGFSGLEIAIMQSAYPIAALLGCMVAPKIVTTVGHARAFGALASICSITALIHMITNDFYSWTTMRALAGFCFPGLYVVSESWLNARAQNETRASLLSIYFVVQVAGSGLGQVLLNIPDKTGLLLFVLASALISLSLVPMLLSPTEASSYQAPERTSLLDVFRLSPFGFIGSFLNGAAQGTLYVGVGILAASLMLSDGTIGAMVATIAIGAAFGQFPIGTLSDRFDRRVVTLLCAAFSVVPAGFLAITLDEGQVGITQFIALGAIGALAVPIYSLCIAHTNDQLKPEQIVPAAGVLVLVLNIGLATGPILGALSLALAGSAGLLGSFICLQILTGFLGAYRIYSGSKTIENRSTVTPMSLSATETLQQLQADTVAEEQQDARQSSQTDRFDE